MSSLCECKWRWCRLAKFCPIRRIPLGRTPLENFEFWILNFGFCPIRRIPLGRTPLGRTPLENFNHYCPVNILIPDYSRRNLPRWRGQMTILTKAKPAWGWKICNLDVNAIISDSVFHPHSQKPVVQSINPAVQRDRQRGRLQSTRDFRSEIN